MPVSYDLSVEAFYTTEGKSPPALLNPGESVFVASREIIRLHNNLTAKAPLKNSRIRQVLSLKAPLYLSCHETVVYFRITNVSANIIEFDTSLGIARIIFEPIEGTVERPYNGTFDKEFIFRGMVDYNDIYKRAIRKIDTKTTEILGIEKRMHANVPTLLVIFAAIFSLVNINIQALSASSCPSLQFISQQ